MKRTHPIPRVLNAAIMAVQLVAIAACLLAVRGVHSWAGLFGLAAVFGGHEPVYAIIHEADHGMLFDDRRVNDAGGVLMALFFPAPFHLLRQGHLGHHMRNRSDDEAFDLYFDGEHPVWKGLQLYGTLTGFYWLMAVISNVVVLAVPFVMRREYFQFDRPSAAFMDALNPRYARLIQIEAAAIIALHVAIVFALDIPLANYAVMYAGFGLSWSAMQYVHHFGHAPRARRRAQPLALGADRSAVAQPQLASHTSPASDGALDLPAPARAPRTSRRRVPAAALRADVERAAQGQRSREEPLCGPRHPLIARSPRPPAFAWPWPRSGSCRSRMCWRLSHHSPRGSRDVGPRGCQCSRS